MSGRQLMLDFDSPPAGAAKGAEPAAAAVTSSEQALSIGPTANVLADWRLAPQLLNIQEASMLTRVPVKTLYKWNADGKLRGIATRVGKQLRFDRDALLRMWLHGKKAAK